MKRTISIAAWLALFLVAGGPSLTGAAPPADPISVDNASVSQQGQTMPGIAKTPAAAISWQAKEMARIEHQKRAEERRQLEMRQGSGAQASSPGVTATNKRTGPTKKRTAKTKKQTKIQVLREGAPPANN